MTETRVLIADDSPSLRQLLAQALAGAGYQPVEAVDGQAALERLARGEGFNLALVDFHMPRVDGLGVLRALRRTAATRFIPILMLTAETRPEHRQAAREAGATGWVVKPVRLEELLGLVRRLRPLGAGEGAP